MRLAAVDDVLLTDCCRLITAAGFRSLEIRSRAFNDARLLVAVDVVVVDADEDDDDSSEIVFPFNICIL